VNDFHNAPPAHEPVSDKSCVIVPEQSGWFARLTLLTASHIVGTLHSVSVLAMSPIIRDELNLSTAQIGLFMSAYYGAQSLCVFSAGALADRVGIRVALVSAHVLLIAGAVLMATAASLITALVAMAIMGAGYSIINPATARAVLEWFPSSRRATAMGIKQTGVPVGGVLAAICGILATLTHWQNIIWLITALTCLNMIFCLRLGLPSQERNIANDKSHSIAQAFKAQFSNRKIRNFACVNICLQISQANFFTFLTVFLRDVALASQPLAAACLGLAQSTSAIGRIMWGIVCDRFYSGRRTHLVIQISIAAGFFFMLLAFVEPGPWLWIGVLATAALGLTIAAYAGLTLVIAAESAPADQTGIAVGFNLMAVYVGGVVGPPLFSLAMDILGSYRAGWLMTAAVVFVGVAILKLGLEASPRRTED